MNVLLENNSLFMHIPKTGGSWVKAVLDELRLVKAPIGHEHGDLGNALWHDRFHRDGKVFRGILRRWVGASRAPLRVTPETFKFCFVREPLKWYESYWRFMQGIRWADQGHELDPCKWHPVAMLNGLGSPDFNTFVRNVNRKRPGFVTEMYGWYVRPGVQFVGRQEHLRDDLITVLSQMGLSFDPERVKSFRTVNESDDAIARPKWDPALREETYRLEYSGYVRFKYTGLRMEEAWDAEARAA